MMFRSVEVGEGTEHKVRMQVILSMTCTCARPSCFSLFWLGTIFPESEVVYRWDHWDIWTQISLMFSRGQGIVSNVPSSSRKPAACALSIICLCIMRLGSKAKYAVTWVLSR